MLTKEAAAARQARPTAAVSSARLRGGRLRFNRRSRTPRSHGWEKRVPRLGEDMADTRGGSVADVGGVDEEE